MARVALVSDTHVPSRASAIPDWVRAAIRAADHTVHAGDFDSRNAYEEVVASADGDLTAVRGNLDPPNLDLPEVAAVTVEGVTFGVTHGTGSPAGYETRVVRRVREAVDGPDVAVAGHTHEILDTVHDGLRLLNPGSATGARPAAAESVMVVDVDAGSLQVSTREA